MTSRFERALADLVGGYEGGWALWMVGLMRLELAVGDARDIDRFRSHPEGAWNRLLVNVDDALRTGELAVDLELMLQADGDVKPEDERSRSVADLLLVRARELADARLNMAPDEWERFSPRSRSR